MIKNAVSRKVEDDKKMTLLNGMQMKKKFIVDSQLDSPKFTARLNKLVQLMWPTSYKSLQLDSKTAKDSDCVLVRDKDIESLLGIHKVIDIMNNMSWKTSAIEHAY